MTKEDIEIKKPLSRRRGKSSFEQLVPTKRPHGLFHPKATDRWSFDPRDHRLETNGVTQYSDADVFAWEFLRRNMFYMALVDKKHRCIPEEEWGFRHCIQAKRSHGLIELKPYTEHFHEGKPPSWIGLDSFAQGLQKQKICTEPSEVKVSLDRGQMVVVFDFAKHFFKSPWREQLNALHDHLEQLERKNISSRIPDLGRVHKSVLLRRIRLIDFFSRSKNLREAGVQAKKMQAQDEAIAKGFKPDILGNYPDQKFSKPADYEDLDAAYELTYHHHYLKLACSDGLYKIDGKRMRPITFEELVNVKEKVEITLKNIKGKEHRIV